jgi:tetratricopeptide (TPR) repeat protein
VSCYRAPLSALLAGLLLYGVIVGPFTLYMARKPIEEKLGFVPSIKLIKPLSVDQKELVGASLVMKVLVYFGGIVAKAMEGRVITEPPDLQGMSRLLHGAVQLDPYNMDAYYFAQGFLPWDARQFNVANDLLEHGMKYRTWDWYLPYFAGFNNAYFLKNYAKAAEYYKRAADLSGESLYKSLAGRYMQESGQTELAIAYLSAIEKGEKNIAMKKTFQIRLRAFREARRIEQARDLFREQQGALPATIGQLVQSGLLNPSPVDPYGGSFYLEPDGKVATTSKYAFSGSRGGKQNAGN